MTRPILPPLSRTVADAEAVARIVHQGQVDKAGRPYIEHVERVADRMPRVVAPGLPLEALREAHQIAWLHDVLEPDERPFGPFTFTNLRNEGFSEDVADAVHRLTHQVYLPFLTYRQWIRHIADSAPLPVLLVKLADLEDNSDPARLALLLPDKAASLSKRYEPATAAIRKALEERFGLPSPAEPR